MEPTSQQTFDFKTSEKAFRRCTSSDIAREQCNAIDLLNLTTGIGDKHETLIHHSDALLWGSYRPVFAIKGFEGAFVIPNALPRRMQVEMVYHSLQDCVSPSNRTNLHGHMSVEELFPLLLDLWRKEATMIDSLKGDPCPKIPKSSILSKLRWVTLGYHYDWTERRYHPENYTAFPSGLAAVCEQIGEVLGSEHSVTAEAAIVNFYPEGSVMGGHQDDAEFTYKHPVISISIGAPCLFLLGGLSKEVEPVSIILRSGDILAMGGNCRLSYHGVPKVWICEQPPAYMHPSTAGSEHIHLSSCPMFLLASSSAAASGTMTRNIVEERDSSHNTASASDTCAGGNGTGTEVDDDTADHHMNNKKRKLPRITSIGTEKNSSPSTAASSAAVATAGGGGGGEEEQDDEECYKNENDRAKLFSSVSEKSTTDSTSTPAIALGTILAEDHAATTHTSAAATNDDATVPPAGITIVTNSCSGSSSAVPVSTDSSITGDEESYSVRANATDSAVSNDSAIEARPEEVVVEEVVVVEEDGDAQSTAARVAISVATEIICCTCGCGVSREEEARALRFLQTSRININMRQVYETTTTQGIIHSSSVDDSSSS